MPKKIVIEKQREFWATDKYKYFLGISDEYGEQTVRKWFDTLAEAIKFLGEQWPQ